VAQWTRGASVSQNQVEGVPVQEGRRAIANLSPKCSFLRNDLTWDLSNSGNEGIASNGAVFTFGCFGRIVSPEAGKRPGR
jgi:hypothetical protein